MFVVYVLNQEIGSWDYQCTLFDNVDVLYSLIQLLEEVDHKTDQDLLIQCLIENRRYIGRNLRIYYVGGPEFAWG